MTRNLRGSLLIASMLVVLWATSSQACHRRRACPPAPCGQAAYSYASPTGYYGAGGGYTTAGGGYYGGGYPRTAGYPGWLARDGGYEYGGRATTRAASEGRRPGWGCGPAWASAASGRGADRPQVRQSPCGGPAWTYGLARGGAGGGQLMAPRPVTARPAVGEEIRTATIAAGRHSSGDAVASLQPETEGKRGRPPTFGLTAAAAGP